MDEEKSKLKNYKNSSSYRMCLQLNLFLIIKQKKILKFKQKIKND
jgi:hypothetical protein